jgi:hypothetical protein
VVCSKRGLARGDYRFSRRDVREYTGWGHSQLQVHLQRLQDLEYLLAHRGGRGQSYVYELLYEAKADDKQRFLARLLDVSQLRCNLPGFEDELPGGFRAHSGPIPGCFRPSPMVELPANTAANAAF